MTRRGALLAAILLFAPPTLPAALRSAAPQYEYSSWALRGAGGLETRGTVTGVRYGVGGDWWIERSPDDSDTVALQSDWVQYQTGAAVPPERTLLRLSLGREQKKTVNEAWGFGHRGEMAGRAITSTAWTAADFTNALAAALGVSGASNVAAAATNAIVRDVGGGLGARYEGWVRLTPGGSWAADLGGGGEASADFETFSGSTALPALRLGWNLYARARLSVRLGEVEPYLEYRGDLLRGEVNLLSSYNALFVPAHAGVLGVRFYFTLLLFGDRGPVSRPGPSLVLN